MKEILFIIPHLHRILLQGHGFDFSGSMGPTLRNVFKLSALAPDQATSPMIILGLLLLTFLDSGYLCGSFLLGRVTGCESHWGIQD